MPHVEFVDNQECLDLIEHRQNGILSMLDEELRIPKGSGERERWGERQGEEPRETGERVVTGMRNKRCEWRERTDGREK